MYTVYVVLMAFSFVLFCILPFLFISFPVLLCIFLHHGMIFIIFPGSSCMPMPIWAYAYPSLFYCSYRLSLYSPALSRISRIFLHYRLFRCVFLRFRSFPFNFLSSPVGFGSISAPSCVFLRLPVLSFVCLFFHAFGLVILLFYAFIFVFCVFLLLFPVFYALSYVFVRYCGNVTAIFFSHKKTDNCWW